MTTYLRVLREFGFGLFFIAICVLAFFLTITFVHADELPNAAYFHAVEHDKQTKALLLAQPYCQKKLNEANRAWERYDEETELEHATAGWYYHGYGAIVEVCKRGKNSTLSMGAGNPMRREFAAADIQRLKQSR
jgi:hypothetical protein